MKGHRVLLAALLLTVLPLVGQEGRIEFEPKVGVIGAKVIVRGSPPPGAQLRFAGRPVSPFREGPGLWSFAVPPGAASGFIEWVKGGKVVAKSAVPFVVAGTSLIQQPKLIGLKEAIDVFAYSETRPEGGGKPEPPVRPILKFDENEILTIGEPPAEQPLGPAVELGDAASAGRQPMGQPGFLLTARPPKKKLVLAPVPTPFPTPSPTPTPTPQN